MKIKQQLIILFTLITGIPLVLAGFISYFNAKDALEQAQLHDLQSNVYSRISDIRHVIEMRKEQAQQLAGISGIKGLVYVSKINRDSIRILEEQLNFILRGINNRSEDEVKRESGVSVAALSVCNAKGEVIASTDPVLKNTIVPSERMQHIRAKSSYYNGFQFDSVSGKYYLQVFSAIRSANNKNDFNGAVILRIGSDILNEICLDRAGMGETGEVQLLQLNGKKVDYVTNLRHSDVKPVVFLGDDHGVPSQNAVYGKEGSGFSDDYRGVQTIAFWKQIPELQLGIVGKIDVDEAFASIYSLRNKILVMTCIALFLSVLLGLYFAKRFSDLIQIFVSAFSKISKGEIIEKVEINSKDEFGTLGVAANESITYLKNIRDHANKLAAGNYNDNIVSGSDRDELGDALRKMTDSLSRYDRESRNTIWLQRALSEANDKLRGEQDIKSIGDNVLSQFVAHVQGQVGAFYVADEQETSLNFVSAYANRKNLKETIDIKSGEGLLGQIAKEKKLAVYTDLPDEYMNVHSALGNSAAKAIAVLPLVHDDHLKGIVEIGSLSEFSELHLQFLSRIAESAAIAITSAENRLKIQNLYEEAQAQGEELWTQQEELRELNTELEAQTQKLEASEEELRVHQEELLQRQQQLIEKGNVLESINKTVNEKNEELNDAAMQLEQKAEQLALVSKYKSEFLANMSHELRTPLNSILLLSKLLSDNNENNLTKEQTDFARVINSSGHGLLELINEILDLSKIEAGKMDLSPEKIDVTALCSNVSSLFYPLAGEKGISFKFHVDPRAPKVIETDRMRVEQVLKNLLSNAFKFTNTGSIELNVNLKDGDRIAFSVKDTGIGIPEIKQAIIFEPFQQADGSTRRKYGGTGLGLSISREIALMLCGELTVSSSEGNGSTFTLILPLAGNSKLNERKSSASITENKLPNETDSKSVSGAAKSVLEENLQRLSISDDRDVIMNAEKRLLVIEDDLTFATALIRYSNANGYKVVVCTKADEVLSAALKYKPTGILLDIQLPDRSGWSVLKELKDNESTRHIPVHIMSAHSLKPRDSVSAGAIDFIGKPFSEKEFEEILSRLESTTDTRTKTIVLVDNHDTHLKALYDFLKQTGTTCLIASSADAALSILEEQKVDCLVVNVGVPDTIGYSFLDALEKKKGNDHLPVILYTGKNTTLQNEKKIRDLSESMVIKPVESFDTLMNETAIFLHLIGRKQEARTEREPYFKDNALKNKQVLVVDDDVRNIYSITKVLEAKGIKVIPAINGKEALEIMREIKHVDAVLMDMMMPEMDGYDTTREIRKNSEWQLLPVIAVTAKAMLGDREKCIKAGASDYVTKPVDPEQLIALLRVWLYK